MMHKLLYIHSIVVLFKAMAAVSAASLEKIISTAATI